MAKTQPRGTQILDASIGRDDLDVATAGQAVIRKIIAGTGISISSTGTDAGTGDVTINAGSSGTAVNQTTHGLAVGDLIRYNGTAYVEAKADTAANAEVIGIVSAVADANNFTFRSDGASPVTGLSGLTAGTIYFLSPSTAGLLTATEPSTVGQISKPVFYAISTTSGYFINFRGMLIAAAAVAPYYEDIGDGTTNPVTVTHNLGTKDVDVHVRDNGTDEEVGVGVIDHATTNTVVLTFSTAPTLDQYRVKVAI